MGEEGISLLGWPYGDSLRSDTLRFRYFHPRKNYRFSDPFHVRVPPDPLPKSKKLVGEEGLEPSSLAAYGSEPHAYTSSATRPKPPQSLFIIYENER